MRDAAGPTEPTAGLVMCRRVLDNAVTELVPALRPWWPWSRPRLQWLCLDCGAVHQVRLTHEQAATFARRGVHVVQEPL